MSAAVEYPLVSIGVPVRNGLPYIARAIEDVLAQDYPNIEIIVSDNGSTDATGTLMKEIAQRDSRVRVVSQEVTLTAFDNFEWLMRQSRGKYFLWAAHDDLRPTDYVSALVRHLEAHPEAVLAFGELRTSATFDGTYASKPFDYATESMGTLARVRKTAFHQCYHIYGVWRLEALQRIPFIFNAWWPDLPLMLAASCLGEFHRVDPVCFDYLEIPKTNEQRAQYQDHTAKVNRVARTIKLFHVTFRTVLRVAGLAKAVAATAFVIEKQIWLAVGLMTGRVRRGQY